MSKYKAAFIVAQLASAAASAESLQWEGREFITHHVKASVVHFQGEEVLKVERDLKTWPFDIHHLAQTVDGPTYLGLKDFEFSDGIFEVKVLARLQTPSPFAAARGFIGLHFRIKPDDSAFDSIYLRPAAGRSDSQLMRNHAVQYFAYPDYKFERLRAEANGVYETYADIGLDEWITMRVHIAGQRAELYVNKPQYPSLIVNKLLGTTTSGGIGLFVDIGTVGYFKDFKIISSLPPR